MRKRSKIQLIGHSHIDAVWLWDREETKRVCKDTFEKILDILDKRDDFYFAQSSAQFYEWMEKEAPELFDRIKRHVESRKWEIVGGMWIESDCNLPSGESLVRQLLYGKRYFRRKFGVEVRVGWLPDSFGFCWTLPQILKKSGIDYFLTSKLNWETTLKFPYSLFWWKAPDGSQVLSCETPGGYNNTDARSVYWQFVTWKNEDIPAILLPYGEGDHGGGITEDMIDDVLKTHKESIDVFFKPSLDYFTDVQREYGSNLPIHEDELYLKTHRGTYTTQAKAKWNNRRAEVLMDIAERFSILAYPFGFSYPVDEMNMAWKKLLFAQFHDALAGSSIKKVYEDESQDYNFIFNTSNTTISQALKVIASNVNTAGDGRSILIFNPLSWLRTDVVRIPLESIGFRYFRILSGDGESIPYQHVTEDGREYILFAAKDIPGFGYKEYRIVEVPESDVFHTHLKASSNSLENSLFRIEISQDTGILTQIYDKVTHKRILANRGGNIFHVYQDETPDEGAWNIWLGKLEELNTPESIKVVETGPVRASVEITYRYEQSKKKDSVFKVIVSLYEGLPRIDFDLHIDWNAEHRFSKVGFDLNGKAEFITYEIPYGSIARRRPDSNEANPTERTKWEVSAQKWIDYPLDDDYGVGLLNDSKYGFDVKDSLIRMSLVRSADYPNPRLMGLESVRPSLTDQGVHRVRYALCPHRGDWRSAEIPKRGFEFNYPLFAEVVEGAQTGRLPKEKSFLSVEGKGVLIGAIKKAEDNDGVVIRLYETNGQNVSAQLTFGMPLIAAWETDFMEDKIRDISIESRDEIFVNVGRYEIKTLLIFLDLEHHF